MVVLRAPDALGSVGAGVPETGGRHAGLTAERVLIPLTTPSVTQVFGGVFVDALDVHVTLGARVETVS